MDAPTDLPPLLRARLRPSLTAWLDWLGPQLDDAMLAEIAAADYGYRADEHLATLRLIRDERYIPARATWAASEVLELVRWSQPDDPAWAPGGHGRRGHRMRLFCCAVLIALADDPAIRQYMEEEPTLRQLVASAVALGEAAVEAMLSLLGRRLPTLPPTAGEDRPFFAAAVLLLAAARYRDAGDGPLLDELGRWAIEEEARARAVVSQPALVRDAWLLGLKFSADGDDVWRDLAWRLLIEPATPHPPAAAGALRDVGARLVLGAPDGPSPAPA